MIPTHFPEGFVLADLRIQDVFVKIRVDISANYAIIFIAR